MPENIQNKLNISQIADKLLKDASVRFSKCEVENLLKLFSKCSRDAEKMDRMRFRDVLHNMFEMTDDMLMDRTFKAFDRDNDSLISKEEWVKGMSIYLKGSLEEQAKFCFDVYSMSAVNATESVISREDIHSMLKHCLVKQPTEEDPDEGVKDLVDLMLKKMDFDKDGRLSYEEYRRSVVEDPLLLEAFGPCLPCPKTRLVFLRSIEDPKMKKNNGNSGEVVAAAAESKLRPVP
ncbi:calaxin-like [Symsagittifera roscoffensis]|uniref:calaxin-like n=1 Tax=Symsagittifera roscoffensis TaxID=84072 RepID=UPI00307C6875